jgi:hypothetical protein
MYKKGKGVKQDDFKAFKFYQKLPFPYISPRKEQPSPEFKSHAFW